MGDDLLGAATSATVERQIRSIQQIIIHPQYDAATMENDVAILLVNILLEYRGGDESWWKTYQMWKI